MYLCLPPLQVDKAFDYLCTFAGAPERNMRFAVSCGSQSRGIYLRECHQVVQPVEVVVTIEPVYRDEARLAAPTDLSSRYHHHPHPPLCVPPQTCLVGITLTLHSVCPHRPVW